MGRLAGKIALVTGAASGIGAATALRFAREGARVAGVDLAQAPAERWKQVEEAGPGASFHLASVSSEEEIRRAVSEAVDVHGGLDIVVNAAGVAGGGAVEAMDVAEWDRIMDVNVKGIFLTCKHALPHLRARGGGSIVNIASIEGLVATELTASYGASKGAVVQLTRNLAVDHTHEGIRVNSICPGLVETGMTEILMKAEEGPLGKLREDFLARHLVKRAGTPDEIANAILFLASDEASFVTGAALVVDGGWTAGHRIGMGEVDV